MNDSREFLEERGGGVYLLGDERCGFVKGPEFVVGVICGDFPIPTCGGLTRDCTGTASAAGGCSGGLRQ